MSLTTIRFQRLPTSLDQGAGGGSRSVLYRQMEEGLFTRPVKIGARSSCHPTSEVQAILGARLNGATDEQIRALVADLHEKRKLYLPESMRSAVVLADDES